MARRSPTEKTPKNDDVVFVHGRSADGKTLSVLRKRGDTISASVLAAVEDGKPLHGELLRLRPREDAPALFDVDVLHDATPERAAQSGPAKVASPAYRDGWDSIWGDRARRAPADLN